MEFFFATKGVGAGFPAEKTMNIYFWDGEDPDQKNKFIVQVDLKNAERLKKLLYDWISKNSSLPG